MVKFEERDLAESDPSQYSASSERKSLAQVVGFLFLLSLVIWVAWHRWGFV
jgi:hypothetical protein